MFGEVSAYFTISKSGGAFKELTRAGGAGSDGERLADPRQLLKQPHVVQVLACLRMLGYDNSQNVLISHLSQVRTGEGKSVILGTCSIVLALLGFRVSCTCYSEYLSERDCADFMKLFQAFKVQNRIDYSTITRFSEKKVLSKGNLRKLTEDLLLGSVSSPDARPHILSPDAAAADEGTPAPLNGEGLLLLDEVDVFFGPNFYGQTYNQVAELRFPEARAVLAKIWGWKKCNQRQVLENAKASHEYAALSNKLPGWEFLVEKEVESMCAAVVNLEKCGAEFHYDKKTNRIGYKVFDSVDYEASYGYTTAFHCLELHEHGKLANAEEALSNYLTLRVSCGRLSYAELGQGTTKKMKMIGSGSVQFLDWK